MSDFVPASPWGTVASEPAVPREGKIAFVGRRTPYLGVLLTGLVLMVPTLGLYRFWLVTRKRQFYWGHTEIDGDALEYTGTPTQLLVGFLLAVLIFLPIYGGLFYVTVRLPDFSALAYLVLLPIFYFLMGYASYRSRRFRLSRTLWRGIRFQQSGNAWIYALKRFLWAIATIMTLGLAYPFMARSLWKYRAEHTFFGNRQFAFSGRVRTIAGPFYGAYFLMVVIIGAAIYQLNLLSETTDDSTGATSIAIIGFSLLIVGIGYLAWIFVTTRIKSRYYSSMSAGDARFKVRIRASSVALQHLVYVLLLTLFVIVFGTISMLVAGGMSEGMDILSGSASEQDIARIMQAGSTALFIVIGLYLVFLGLWGVLSETVLGFGYWKIVARGASIENVDSLKSVRAAGTESSLAGEGLADALNVGAY